MTANLLHLADRVRNARSHLVCVSPGTVVSNTHKGTAANILRDVERGLRELAATPRQEAPCQPPTAPVDREPIIEHVGAVSDAVRSLGES